MEKFIAIWDTHVGFERRNGHLKPLHDERAIKAMLAFAKDFKPNTVVLGGDILDCGAISHWNNQKPGATEGMRLAKDAQIARDMIVKPLEKTLDTTRPVKKVFLEGNHEAWITDLIEKEPGLEGLIDPSTLLGFDSAWKVLPQGEIYRLSKHLVLAHGDQVKGGEHCAKAGVVNFQTSIRFGHHHTFQTYTATSPITNELPRTGMAVGCLCTKNQKYGEGKPNKWVQGFLYGYVLDDGTFHDYHATIINGRTVINGKIYRG